MLHLARFVNVEDVCNGRSQPDANTFARKLPHRPFRIRHDGIRAPVPAAWDATSLPQDRMTRTRKKAGRASRRGNESRPTHRPYSSALCLADTLPPSWASVLSSSSWAGSRCPRGRSLPRTRTRSGRRWRAAGPKSRACGRGSAPAVEKEDRRGRGNEGKASPSRTRRRLPETRHSCSCWTYRKLPVRCKQISDRNLKIAKASINLLFNLL